MNARVDEGLWACAIARQDLLKDLCGDDFEQVGIENSAQDVLTTGKRLIVIARLGS